MPGPHPVFRVARTCHAWAGAALSLLLVLIASTGALLVWKDDYLRLTIPAARAEFDPTPANLARIAEAADATFEPNTVLFMDFPTRGFGLATVMLWEDEFAYLDVDGDVVARWPLNGRFEDWLFDLHHRLLLGTTGLYVAGFAGLATAILVLAGAIAFWPMRRAFKLGPALRGADRPSALLSHRNIGIVAALPVILAVTTGASLAFPDTSRDVFLSPLRGDFSYSEAFSDGLDDLTGAEVAGWEAALTRAQASFPDAEIVATTWPDATPPYRIIYLKQPGEWHPQGATRVYIDAREGWMDIRIDAKTLPWEEDAYNALYPIHTASFGGLLYKLYATATGLALAALGLLGAWAFLRRWVKAGGA